MRGALRLLLLLAIELTCFIALVLLDDPGTHFAAFLLLFSVAAAAFLLACRYATALDINWRILGLAALLLRLPLLPGAPVLSDDVWRYLHDGRAQMNGVNPFRYAPADPATVPFRGPEFGRINHPDLPTIYPPAAQLGFAAAALPGASLWSWKAILLLFDAAACALLVLLLKQAQRPVGFAALYAWHPLVIIELAGSAHMDLLAIAPLLLGLFLLRRAAANGRAGVRNVLGAGIAFGMAVAAKLLPLAYLPILLRHGRAPFAAGAAITLLLLYAGYGAFSGVPVFGSLGTFVDHWQSNASIYPVLARHFDLRTLQLLCLTLLIVAVGALLYRRTDDARSLLIITLVILILSPVVHPWYLVWLVPLIALQKRHGLIARTALAWTLTVPLAYAVLPVYRTTGIWAIPDWAWRLEYGAVLLCAGALALSRRVRSAQSGRIRAL